MTEAELLTVAHDSLTRMDVIFEFWMGATFAVLVTFYFIRGGSTKLVRRVSAVLYIMFSALMFNRWGSISLIYLNVRDELLEMGSIGVIDNVSYWINTALWPSTFVFGTITAVYFIFAHENILAKSRERDT